MKIFIIYSEKEGTFYNGSMFSLYKAKAYTASGLPKEIDLAGKIHYLREGGEENPSTWFYCDVKGRAMFNVIEVEA